MQVDTASFRALNEEITSLSAQLAKHKELQVKAAAEYERRAGSRRDAPREVVPAPSRRG